MIEFQEKINKKHVFKMDKYQQLQMKWFLVSADGYELDLNQPIYLNNLKKNKFWEVTITDSAVRYRAGVLRGDQQHKVIEVDKDYESNTLARATVITKIAWKIDKRGYISKTAKKIEPEDTQKKPVRRRKREKMQQTCDQTDMQTVPKSKSRRKSTKMELSQNNTESNKTMWKGLERENEIIQLYVVGNQLKITRKDEEKESTEPKSFGSFDEAVNHVLRKERVLLAEGFTPTVSSAFKSQTAKKESSSLLNPFSTSSQKLLVNMTDKALQSIVLKKDEEGENVYLPNYRLGPPTDSCIKCLLAQNYKDGVDPTDWIMSEKLDGVRCLWTGTEMYSRNGNKFNFPNFFTRNWPKSQLDGELFVGRGRFSQTLSAVKKNVPVASQWQKVKYLVFDAPGLNESFKLRIKILEEELAKVDNPFLKCHAHRPCKGFADLFYELQNVNKAKGEGIMLRQPEALYENKRSKNLQKVKTFYDDQAEVIGYTEGTGRCAGWIGSLRVKNGKGIQFEVGSGLNDQMRKNPPEIGSMITYKYQEFNKDSGKPRFPTFLRMFNPT